MVYFTSESSNVRVVQDYKRNNTLLLLKFDFEWRPPITKIKQISNKIFEFFSRISIFK